MKCAVYNLKFRTGCHEMDIAGFRFSRVADYAERLRQLQHLTECHSEISVCATTGGHAHTADVEFDEPCLQAVLGWDTPSASALKDVILLLSLFTNRHVFYVEEDEDPTEGVIIAESRVFPWGGVLATSIPYDGRDPKNGGNWREDVSLGKGIGEIYSRIRQEEWLAEYDRGHFLLLALNAFQQRLPVAAFIHCWTIWEHLFCVLTRSWLTAASIRHLNAAEKIAYILVRFAVRENLQEKEKKRLESLAAIRNRLIHHGHLPESEPAGADAMMFVRMTEFVIAKILGLQPSNIFNTMEKFEEFLTRKE